MSELHSRFAAALALRALTVAMMRQAIVRAHPEASIGEIDRMLRARVVGPPPGEQAPASGPTTA